ncbi:MAG: ribosome biogenesis GTP-binding protein YihA/YsxC [Bacteroidales bacterium]|jgi:GTP-binding protein|nr:ribosome biogenesis GTP-binding protein YihA/YsxC [Bacteroidales bacterium]
MQLKTIKFLQSEADWRRCPPPALPEFAFIGRSNVGKSSLINMLANHKSLAKISSKPGKTRTINHFLVNNAWYLVDLPGYGYAVVSKTMRAKWESMIRDYLNFRTNLQIVFVLIDSRLEPQQKDIDFINTLGELGLPFALIFTKADKLSATATHQNIMQFRQKLLETWEELPAHFITSAVTAKGREELLNYIEQIINQSNTEINRNQNEEN